MKISSIELKEEVNGIKPFISPELGNVVLLTGSNGAGKTRLLKIIDKYINNLREGRDDKRITIQIKDKETEQGLNVDTVKNVKIANYSHYDANLQSFKEFTPYVIHQAKDILKECNYEETALNSLLLISDMVNGYSEEFRDKEIFNNFSKDLKNQFDIELIEKDGNIFLCGLELDKCGLSPGQQYLLRIAVACFCNLKNDKLIFFLDEPELHLHPSALIKAIKYLRNKFDNAQFWISTHSLALISNMSLMESDTTILYVSEGEVNLFRSNSEKLLNGLLGGENNRIAMQKLISTPDEYACNKFATECYTEPEVVDAKKNDPQNWMIEQILKEGDFVLDYGVGKGRFFEGLGIDYSESKLSSKIQYYAYDKYPTHAEKCKTIMEKYGSTKENYFNSIDELLPKAKGKVDYVLLVNVLHEIPTHHWKELFSNIYNLLNDKGQLVIVELEELKTGEAPYDNRFLMITENAVKILFDDGSFECRRHPEKNFIVKYTINKSGINIDGKKIRLAIEQIKEDSFNNIRELKEKKTDGMDKGTLFRNGIKLAFWLHQYANSILILDDDYK